MSNIITQYFQPGTVVQCTPYHYRVVGKHDVYIDAVGNMRLKMKNWSKSKRIASLHELLHIINNNEPQKVMMPNMEQQDKCFTDATKQGQYIRAGYIHIVGQTFRAEVRNLPEVVDINVAEYEAIKMALLAINDDSVIIYNDNQWAVRQWNLPNVVWISRAGNKMADRLFDMWRT